MCKARTRHYGIGVHARRVYPPLSTSKLRAYSTHNAIQPCHKSAAFHRHRSVESNRDIVESNLDCGRDEHEEDSAMSKSNAQVQTGPHEWKPEDIKCTVGAPVKPRRPYTPYNLFYLLERERVVQKNEPAMALEKKVKSEQIRKTRPFEIQNREEEKIPMPKRYDNVIMLPQWYDPNLKEKRKHRKSAGKVSQ